VEILTIGLLAVLALGLSFPQAFAAATTDSIMTVVKDIQAKVNSSVFGLSAIKTAVDTKASQTSVNNLQETMLTQIITTSQFTVGNSDSGKLKCISDGPFIAHIIASGTGAPELFIEISPDEGSLASLHVPVPGSYTVGGDDTEKLVVSAQTDGSSSIHAIVTFQTTEGADASCSF
jgi:hypothetical protein